MEKLRPYVVPQAPGTIEEIKGRFALGQERFPKLRDFRTQQLHRFMQQFPAQDIGMRLPLFSKLYPDPGGEYILDFEPPIDPQEVAELMLPLMDTARKIFHHAGVALPEDVLSRIVVASEATFNNVILQEYDQDPYVEGEVGTITLPNRLVLYNPHRAAVNCKMANVDPAYFVGRAISYELFDNSLAYKEVWSLGWRIKRDGLAVSPPTSESVTFYMTSLLKDGFSELLTREILPDKHNLVSLNKASPEVELVAALADKVGFDLLVWGMYLKEGFKEFAKGLDRKYGKGALRRIIQLMFEDCTVMEEAQKQGIRYPFQQAIQFLRAA